MDGLLLFRGKLMLGKDSTLKKAPLKEFHETLIGGHTGIQRTYIQLAANFFLGMDEKGCEGISWPMFCMSNC